MERIKLSRLWELGPQFKSGGFGRIHAAQSESGEEAVVKLIPKMPGASRELLFEELNGVPNVIPILDRGEWTDFWVIVMPRAEKSLREYLDEQSGSSIIDDTVMVLIDITKALVAIEGRVVHRDLKPDNVLLLEGQWCLVDFGIARYAEATTAPDTQKYAMTPAYAAPEQWRGERATTATDVYALGVIAYEMIAGQKPFPGPEIHDFRRQHLEASLSQIPTVPAPLQSLIAECLYKAPQARPTPRNLLTRLKASATPTSEAAQRLQRANQAVVGQRAEAVRQSSVAQSEAERHAELFRVAEQALGDISRSLHVQIAVAAPQGVPAGGSAWPCTLNNAQLSVATAQKTPRPPSDGRYLPPFEVVAHSKIILSAPRDRWGYEGRSHSLWYCDAQEEGVLRWYESAFMITPLIARRGTLDPFALEPGEEAYGALSPVMTEYQVAWPFTPIDQGCEGEFIERWINWFADAAEGKLRHPTHMPERDPKGSWRRA